jgi:hypothetical protein
MNIDPFQIKNFNNKIQIYKKEKSLFNLEIK